MTTQIMTEQVSREFDAATERAARTIAISLAHEIRLEAAVERGEITESEAKTMLDKEMENAKEWVLANPLNKTPRAVAAFKKHYEIKEEPTQ